MAFLCISVAFWPHYKKDMRNVNLRYLKIHRGAVRGRKNHPETKLAFRVSVYISSGIMWSLFSLYKYI